jgi:hypothetical protein
MEFDYSHNPLHTLVGDHGAERLASLTAYHKDARDAARAVQFRDTGGNLEERTCDTIDKRNALIDRLKRGGMRYAISAYGDSPAWEGSPK